MYAIHLRSIGSWMRRAVCTAPAPSMRRGLDDLVGDAVERAVHDDDPAAGAGPERDDGEEHRQVPGRDDSAKLSKPKPLQQPPTGLAVGSRRNSQSSTLDAPARAPGR